MCVSYISPCLHQACFLLISCFILKVSPLCGFLCFKFPPCVLSSSSLLSCPFIGLLLFSSGFLITAFGYFLLFGLVVWFLLFPACPCNFCNFNPRKWAFYLICKDNQRTVSLSKRPSVSAATFTKQMPQRCHGKSCSYQE